MKVGITGTRNSLTEKQVLEIAKFVESLPEGSELHHGDCQGADYYVAQVAKHYRLKTVCHPPIDESLRAFHPSTEIRPPNTYLARNRTIVDSVELLLVVPMQDEWQPKGGTWYTHDYAKKKRVPVKLFWPTKPD